jgi:hypothetical protein
MGAADKLSTMGRRRSTECLDASQAVFPYYTPYFPLYTTTVLVLVKTLV